MMITCLIENGKITSNRHLFVAALSQFSGDVNITIKKKSKVRSVEQNRYYWGVVIPIIKNLFEHYGHKYTKEFVHKLLCARFLKQVIEIGGELHDSIRSTSDLNTSEFEDFLHMVREYVMDTYDCDIPLPNEQTKLF